MGTTAEKLYKILDSKEEIKQALIAKGINITDETTFAEYAEKINEITNGGAITDEEALLFIKDLADGKRKIAKAVRSKYETITNEESGITEYSTFDELSNKISQIPIEVPLGSAMEQNGGVLPFYDVYNESLKAMKEFAGYGFNGCCAFELDKWSYDNDHTITLSGASAYYTSDKGELITTDTEYRFKDIDQPNTNRFVVFFYNIEEEDKYVVPTYLPATSVLNLWCIKGTPLISFNGNYTALNSINVYDGSLEATTSGDFYLGNLPVLQTLQLSHIRSYSYKIIQTLAEVRKINMPNLIETSGLVEPIVTINKLTEIVFPSLKTIATQLINHASMCRKLSAPELEKSSYRNGGMVYQGNIRHYYLPKLKESSCPITTTQSKVETINLDSFEVHTGTSSFLQQITMNELYLPRLHSVKDLYHYSNTNIPIIHLGNGMRNGVAGDIKILGMSTSTALTTLTVAEGFKAELNLTGCNGLSREVLVDILNNLADLTDTEYADKLTLTLGSTLYDRITADDRLIATNKKWQVVK